jgi:hypothetical protein
MAVNITKTNLNSTDFVANTSRYYGSDVYYWGDNQQITFETYKKENTYPESPQDKFTIISPGMEYRPDKMSVEVYGHVDWWWKIMEANGIKDIYDFKAGRNIRLPATYF